MNNWHIVTSRHHTLYGVSTTFFFICAWWTLSCVPFTKNVILWKTSTEWTLCKTKNNNLIIAWIKNSFGFRHPEIIAVAFLSSFKQTNLYEPFNSQINFVILLTVNHTVPVMLVQRIWYRISYSSPNWYFSLFSSLIWLILYWYCKEKFCLGHS